MATIGLVRVTKSFGATPVIHGIDCAIGDGEFIVVVGPSGCGKSTLIRMVAGLEDVSSGEIFIGDRLVNTVEPKDRDIAMVFQNYALYPHMSVFENMAYGLRIRGLSNDEIRRRVGEAAAILELGSLLERKPRALSGGQRQRVAMGRAIVRQPKAFLFDEPLSNLDAKLRLQMRVEIKQLQRRSGTTSIYVTHDQVEAMTLADRLVVLNAGKVEQIGPPIDLYRTPASLFVAGFLGSPGMNLLPATGAGDHIVMNGGLSLAIPATAGRALMVGIRPEDIIPVDADGGADTLSLAIDLVERLGADSIVYGRAIENGHTLSLRLGGLSAVGIGGVVHARLPLDRLHLFDQLSGRRL